MYHWVEKGNELAELFKKRKNVRYTDGLAEVLADVGEVKNYNLDLAIEYFLNEENENCQEDVVDLDKITFESFSLRLGNCLLEQIHSLGNFDKDLKEFIKETRENQGKDKKLSKKQEEKAPKNKGKKEKKSDDEKSSANARKDLLGVIGGSIINEKPNAKKSGKLKKIWSVQSFEEHEGRIKEIFAGFDKNTGKIKTADLTRLFIDVTTLLEIPVHPHKSAIFIHLIESLQNSQNSPTKAQIKKSPLIQLEFPEFSEIFKIWGGKYNEDFDKTSGKLSTLIEKFSNLKEKNTDFPTISNILTSLTQDLQNILSTCLNENKADHLTQKTIKKNIEEIFLFYGKAQKIQGAVDTFEGLENSNTSWSLGKFLKFCTDFNLCIVKIESDRGVTKDQLSVIFKKTATNTRLMTEAQFLVALDKVSEVLYSVFFDKLLNTNFAYLPTIEKRKKLYKFLELHLANSYHSKVKAFAVPHTPENQVRIPQIKSPRNLQYKMPDSLVRQIDSWHQKKKLANQTPPTLRSSLALNIKKTQKLRKSTEELPPNGLKYALRMKMQKKPVEKLEVRLTTPVEEKTFSKNATSVITMQALSHLDYDDIDDENDLKDLISDEKDEYFDKIYGIEPRLQGILRLHDNKVLQGQKVLERLKLT